MMSIMMMILIVEMMRRYHNIHPLTVILLPAAVVRREELKDQMRPRPLNMILMCVEDEMSGTWRRLYQIIAGVVVISVTITVLGSIW